MENGDQWKEMVEAFDAFVRCTGHGAVPAHYPENPPLGRWVAMIRYRRKIGELDPTFVDQLDRKGFCWSAGERVWEEMFRKLLAFRQEFGHCDAPTTRKDDSGLGGWVARQRLRYRQGTLDANRVQRLEEIGFKWKVYGRTAGEAPEPAPAGTGAAVTETPQPEERLYHVRADGYVQYNGGSELPPKLSRYLARHRHWPPYIPLPTSKTRFVIKTTGCWKVRRVYWRGCGPLPAEILAHVNENGCLPPQK